MTYDIELYLESVSSTSPQFEVGSEHDERIHLSKGGDFEAFVDGRWMSFQKIIGGRGKVKTREDVVSGARLIIGARVKVVLEEPEMPGHVCEYAGVAKGVGLVTIDERVEPILKS